MPTAPTPEQLAQFKALSPQGKEWVSGLSGGSYDPTTGVGRDKYGNITYAAPPSAAQIATFQALSPVQKQFVEGLGGETYNLYNRHIYFPQGGYQTLPPAPVTKTNFNPASWSALTIAQKEGYGEQRGNYYNPTKGILYSSGFPDYPIYTRPSGGSWATGTYVPNNYIYHENAVYALFDKYLTNPTPALVNINSWRNQPLSAVAKDLKAYVASLAPPPPPPPPPPAPPPASVPTYQNGYAGQVAPVKGKNPLTSARLQNRLASESPSKAGPFGLYGPLAQELSAEYNLSDMGPYQGQPAYNQGPVDTSPSPSITPSFSVGPLSSAFYQPLNIYTSPAANPYLAPAPLPPLPVPPPAAPAFVPLQPVDIAPAQLPTLSVTPIAAPIYTPLQPYVSTTPAPLDGEIVVYSSKHTAPAYQAPALPYIAPASLPAMTVLPRQSISPPIVTSISPAGAAFIKQHEGLKLTSYADGKGSSVGYGHYLGDGSIPGAVTITQSQADDYFDQDIQKVNDAIDANVTVPLTQDQFDALADFAYNVGTGIPGGSNGFLGSTLLTLLNQGNYQGAADQLPLWVHSNGVVDPTLVARRTDDYDLFTNDFYSSNPTGAQLSLSGSDYYVSPLVYNPVAPATLDVTAIPPLTVAPALPAIDNPLYNLPVAPGSASTYMPPAVPTTYSPSQNLPIYTVPVAPVSSMPGKGSDPMSYYYGGYDLGSYGGSYYSTPSLEANPYDAGASSVAGNYYIAGSLDSGTLGTTPTLAPTQYDAGGSSVIGNYYFQYYAAGTYNPYADDGSQSPYGAGGGGGSKGGGSSGGGSSGGGSGGGSSPAAKPAQTTQPAQPIRTIIRKRIPTTVTPAAGSSGYGSTAGGYGSGSGGYGSSYGNTYSYYPYSSYPAGGSGAGGGNGAGYGAGAAGGAGAATGTAAGVTAGISSFVSQHPILTAGLAIGGVLLLTEGSKN